MTLNELEESKQVARHQNSSESEIDPQTWVSLRLGGKKATCITEH